jgi:hypothetical protein
MAGSSLPSSTRRLAEATLADMPEALGTSEQLAALGWRVEP